MVFDNITPTSVFEELRFVLELLGGELLFALPCCKRKEKFALRFSLGFVVMILYSLFYFVISQIGNVFQWINNIPMMTSAIIIGHYCVLTILSSFFLFFCFDFSFDQAILHTIIGYAIQHICYVLFTEMMARTWFPVLDQHVIAYIFVSIFGFLFLCGILYFVVVRKFRDLDYVRLGSRKSTYVIYFAILFVTIFLTFAGQAVYQNSETTRIVINPNYLGACISLMTCGLVILAVYLLYVENQKSKEREIVSQMLYEQGKQYEVKKESIETMKRLAHDMKHKLLAVKAENKQSKELLESMEQDISSYDMIYNTENEALNVLLLDRQLSNKNDGIIIEFDGDGSLVSFMDASDLYVFLGNALDNSIEAIQRGNVSQKRILLSIKEIKGIISVMINNSYEGEIEMKNNTIQTKKQDDYLHGIGIKSMRHIVEKYHGILNISTKDHIFSINAVLSISK